MAIAGAGFRFVKVALDTHSLYVTRAGTARYVRGLLSGFRQLSDTALTLSELVWPVGNLTYTQPLRATKTVFRELIWAPWIAPSMLCRMGAELLHRTTPSLPIRLPAGMREVVTLHDLAVLRQPGRFRRWQGAVGIRRLELLRRADRIICVSQFTADEAMQLLSLPAKQLEVVHHGIEFETGTDETPFPGAPDSFFLFVGSLEPGKNLKLLHRCYALAESRGIALPPLLIVGSRWEGVATEDPPPADWHYLGHQPDAVLATLYRRAIALLFPSLYEGFGFPLLEAMARGCPVICGKVASLPEIGGDAAHYAALEPEPFLKAMQQIESDPALRDELCRCGPAQSAGFTWDKAARETLHVYSQVLR